MPARFMVVGSFRLQSMNALVLRGNILDGTVKSNTHFSFDLDSGPAITVRVDSVEYIDRMRAREFHIGLLLKDLCSDDMERLQGYVFNNDILSIY